MELREKAYFNRIEIGKCGRRQQIKIYYCILHAEQQRGGPSMKVEINYICGGIFPGTFRVGKPIANKLYVCMFGLLCKHVPPIFKKGCFERNLNAEFIERFVMEINRFNMLFIPFIDIFMKCFLFFENRS